MTTSGYVCDLQGNEVSSFGDKLGVELLEKVNLMPGFVLG